jgi:hypothetical protein
MLGRSEMAARSGAAAGGDSTSAIEVTCDDPAKRSFATSDQLSGVSAFPTFRREHPLRRGRSRLITASIGVCDEQSARYTAAARASSRTASANEPQLLQICATTFFVTVITLACAAMRRTGPLAAALALAPILIPSAALARVDGATTIAGPDPAVIALGGVAMAPDGSGGVVYSRFEAGRAHVYAARYDGRRWLAPQRVDVGQRFDSSWPRIAAGVGGRLVVTWVQDGGEGTDRLYSAALAPGAELFQPPTAIDLRVGEALGTLPSLAMAPSGNALIVYRVVTATSTTARDLPSGYVKSEIRLARFDGWRWKRFGQPVNRTRSAPMRDATAATAPRVAITPGGNGAVAWQEPDERLVDRVWVRRVFDARVSIPLQASPAAVDGVPVDGHADALSLDETALGRVVVATRQQPGPRERGAGARIFVAELPETADEQALRLTGGGPRAAEPAGAPAPGPPSVALGTRDELLLAYPRAQATALAAGEGSAVTALGSGAPDAADPRQPLLDAGAAGRGTLAVASGEGGGRVLVQQLLGAGAVLTQPVASAVGGPVREIAVAGAGSGDALVAFAQGEQERGQIAVARVQAPPVPFTVQPPVGWIRARAPLVTWDPAPPGLQPRFFTLELDGRAVLRTGAARHRFAAGTLGEGVHAVRVVATSSAGETTATDSASLLIDRTPPRPLLRRRGRVATVRIVDGRAGAVAGPAEESSSVRWGDGRTSADVSDRATHRYRRGGSYRVVVRARDEAGNTSTTRLTLAVPSTSGPQRSTRARSRPRARSPARSRARAKEQR